MSKRMVLRRLRVVVYAIAAAAIAVLVLRYETLRLPERGCSPLQEFAPGTRLLLDRWRSPGPGDAVLFRANDELLLGRLLPAPRLPAERPAGWAPLDEDHVWIVADAPDCPAVDSRTLGPIATDAIEAVLAAGLPW